jgi:hypothetical protein
MCFSLASPFVAVRRVLLLMGLVYLASLPLLAPLRPEVIDAPLSRYHAAVNSIFTDNWGSFDQVPDALRRMPEVVRQRFEAMLKR